VKHSVDDSLVCRVCVCCVACVCVCVHTLTCTHLCIYVYVCVWKSAGNYMVCVLCRLNSVNLIKQVQSFLNFITFISFLFLISFSKGMLYYIIADINIVVLCQSDIIDIYKHAVVVCD